MMLIFVLCAVNFRFSAIGCKNSKPKSIMLLGLDYSFVSLGNYVCMMPELAARQAPGIIIRDAPVLKLVWLFQFGTMSSYPVYAVALDYAHCIVFVTRCQVIRRSAS